MNDGVRHKKIGVILTETEHEELQSFLKATGRKAGPFIKKLLREAMDREKRLMELELAR